MKATSRHEARPAGGGGWRRRILYAILLVVPAYFSLTATAANVLARTAPIEAHAIAPSNGAIAALAAQSSFLLKPSASADAPAETLARQALMHDATAADALTVLGFQAQLRGEQVLAGQFFAYSLKLSRRELRSRLWAIEESVGRGDIAGALRNYDIALRTSREAPNILFPVLTTALREPRVRAALHSVLRADPVWRESFVSFAARNARAPQFVADLFDEAAGQGLTVAPDDRAALVNLLASNGLHDRAWAQYRVIRPGVTRSSLRDRTFAMFHAEPAVFDWVAIDADGRAATFGQKGGGLDFTAPASVGGIAVQQHLLLPASTYRIAGTVRDLDQPAASLPYWALYCADGRELGRVEVPNAPSRTARYQGLVTVPTDCKVQRLALMLRPSDELRGVTGRIESVSLVPASAQARLAS